MEKRKLLLKDGTAIILEAGFCLGQMEAAYEEGAGSLNGGLGEDDKRELIPGTDKER